MQVHYITTTEEGLKAISKLKTVDKLCLDFETTGLQPGLAKPRLLQLCDATPGVEDRDVYVFDLFKIDVKQEIKDLIESRAILIIHNANFDLQFLLYMGIDYKNKIFDTYVAERVLRSGFKEKKYHPKSKKPYFADVSCSLKAVAERRLDVSLDKTQQVSDWSKDELELDQIEYAGEDIDILPNIAAQQINELKEEGLMDIYSIESKCIRPVARMCSTGFCMNLKMLHELREKIRKDLEDKTKEFVTKLDERLPEGRKLPRNKEGSIAIGKNPKNEFNPGSGDQVIAAFEFCSIEVPRDSVTGSPTLNQIALSEFDSQDEVMNIFRSRKKVETELRHAEKLIENIHPITQRLHAGYNQVGANSGRFTSNGAPRTAKGKNKTVYSVNIQQIPRSKQFRECFVATKGYKLVICDWAQIELRLGAELISIPQMREAFANNVDLHSLTASLIYKIPIEEVTKEQRQEGKTLNFALQYGMGYRKYKTYAAQSGKLITLSEAKVAHAAFHTAYPRLRRWHQERAALVEDGWAYARTACGRRRLLSYDDATMMCSANTLIQGSGADILKIAIAKLDEHLNDDVRLVACIHDELVMEVREDLAEKYKNVLEKAMVEAAEVVLKNVPAEADANIGTSWADK